RRDAADGAASASASGSTGRGAWNMTTGGGVALAGAEAALAAGSVAGSASGGAAAALAAVRLRVARAERCGSGASAVVPAGRSAGDSAVVPAGGSAGLAGALRARLRGAGAAWALDSVAGWVAGPV